MRLGHWRSSRALQESWVSACTEKNVSHFSTWISSSALPYRYESEPSNVLFEQGKHAGRTSLRLRNSWDSNITVDRLSEVISSIALDQ